MIIWFTGQPGSGKTTLCKALKEQWSFWQHQCVHIDGDDIREIFSNKNYNFDGRVNNIKTAQNIARFLHNKNYKVLVSLVSPYRWMRESLKGAGKGHHFRKNQPNFNVLEIYCHTTEERGRENYFVEDYEPPLTNFLDMDTTNKTEKECIDEILFVYRQMATIP